MSERSPYHDQFIATLKAEAIPISVFLVNGIQLTGKVIDFDVSALLVEDYSKRQIIYRHAIATIVPKRSMLWN